VLQIWLLSLFLGTNFLKFGFENVKLFRHGLNQPESKYFPRETLCDFHVREPLRGGEPLQRITVQCVLTVNLFNQVLKNGPTKSLISVKILSNEWITSFPSRISKSQKLILFILANIYIIMDLVWICSVV
jgi:hypothetical protein